MPARRIAWILPVIIAVVGMTFVRTSIAEAGSGSLEVTTSEDELNADGDCSLREAVMAINTQAPVDACPGDVGSRNILIQPIEYQLTIAGAGEEAGMTGDLDLHRPVQIDVIPAGRATIDAGGLDRIFDMHPTTDLRSTAFTGISLMGGDAGSGDGGAIRIADAVCDGSPGSRRDVSVFDVSADGNRASRGGGIHLGECTQTTIIASSIVRNAAADVGGGVSIIGDSVLSFDSVTISNNTAGTAGGGVWADLSGEPNWGVQLATLAENAATDGGGFWSATNVQPGTSILARNEGGNCGGPGGAVGGGFSDDDTCGSPGRDDLGLLPLTIVNGTPVHPLAPRSAAIEAAGEPPHGNGWCSENLRSDQIGTYRPLDGDGDGVAMCDAGAIEAPAVPLQPPNPSASPAPLPDTAVGAATESAWGGVAFAILTLLVAAEVLRSRRRWRAARHQ